MSLFSKPNDPKGRIMVWPHHKIAYVRVPKCANKSLCNALDGGSEEKVDLSELRRQYPGYKFFSFVRNPWARLVSNYNAKMSRAKFAEKNVPKRLREINRSFKAGMPFEEFAALICRIPDKRIEKHFRSQSYFLKQDGILIPDFIGRLERIKQDWPMLEEKMGTRLLLRHEHRGVATDYRSYYSDADILDRVRIRYAEDVSTFRYEFSEFPSLETAAHVSCSENQHE